MAQPPLSQAIRRLEHELDARLFNRTSRSVDLTEAGKVLLADSLFFAGNTIIHVLSDTQPKGFEPVEGGLEDVYFSTLSTLRRAA